MLAALVYEQEVEQLRKRVADRIRELATRKGLTLTDLADRAEVSQAAFWAAMKGRSGPSIDYLAKVAAALGVDPGVLVKKPRSGST